MKWFICFFSLYIVLLSGIPCSADDSCCIDETGQADHADHKPVSPCSPFFSCSTCTKVVLSKVEFELQGIELQDSKLPFFYSDKALPQAAYPIWQPPQLV